MKSNKVLRFLRHRIDANQLLISAVFINFLIFFVGSLPFLDGNIDLVQTLDFYTGSFQKYFENWASVHPPLKLILNSYLFKIFGVNTVAYNLLGIFFGTLGVNFFYRLILNLFKNKQLALISALLLAANPLFLTTAHTAMTDFILTNLIIIALYLYQKKDLTGVSILSLLIVLTKETGLVFVGSLIIIEIFSEIYLYTKNKKAKFLSSFKKLLLLLIPIFGFIMWSQFLATNNKTHWGDWIFTETADKGGIYTVFYNLISFNFVNEYAIQNWQQLFILNFNWLFLLIGLIALVTLLWRLTDKEKKSIIKSVRSADIKYKTLGLIILYSTIYTLTILSFQTYTVTRYGLPVYPALMLLFGYGAYTAFNGSSYRQYSVSVVLSLLLFCALFFSIDPVSTKLWGKTKVLGQELYALNEHLGGNDALTYNLQFLILSTERSKLIFKANETYTPIVSEQCHYIFADPNNDFTTFNYLRIQNIPEPYCTTPPALQTYTPTE